MADLEVAVNRPQRWDTPFAADMTPADVDRLLGLGPFKTIDASAFPPSLPLRGILQNDTRIARYDPGDIVVREGDYGNSAFLILDGRMQVVLQSLAPELMGRSQPKGRGWIRAIAQLWKNHSLPEVREDTGSKSLEANGFGTRQQADNTTRVFLQDVPRVLEHSKTVHLEAGEFFGELAALSRTPRTATIVADSSATLLEIRWQGLRDLMRRTPALTKHVEQLYRENSLRVHLREMPLLEDLSVAAMDRVAEATEFESYGNFSWHTDFGSYNERDAAEQLAAEPLIATEGEMPTGLLLVRSGFARVSHRYGRGHRTVAYLGKGQVFGLDELVESCHSGQDVPLRHSLRGVGYVDVLRIPLDVVRESILPSVNTDQYQPTLPLTVEEPTNGETTDSQAAIDPRLLDFLSDHRILNGTQTMLVNLDRCTRCDDCVRACAATHDNNPRFVRQGPSHDHVMVANACMHCVDPVCMIGCPTGAIARDPSTGIVRINDQTCIGCATCSDSCPYDAIRMVEIRDPQGAFFVDEATNQPIVKATKCDFCSDQPIGPACQHACPHDALVRIDMSNLDGLASWLGR